MSQDETDGWSKRARIGLLVLGILLGAVAAPAIYAQVQTTEDYHMGEGMIIGSPSGLQVELGQNLTNDRQHLSPSDDAVDLRPVSFEADGSAYVNVSDWDTPYLTLEDVDASSNALRVRPTGSHSDVTIDGAASRVEVGAVAVDDGTDDLRVTTSGSTTLDVWGLPADETVIAVDGDTGDRIQTFQTDGEGAGTFTLSQSRDVQFQSAQAPTITDPQPADGTTVSNYSTTLSADVSDPDFDGVGDDVTVTFWDVDAGTQIHQETISSEQTVSTDWSGLDMGENRWNVTAVDSDDNRVALGPQTVRAPNVLEIRDETTLELINDSNVNVTVGFYPENRDSPIVQKEVDDGTLSLDGLVSDQEYTISVEAEGYHPRTTIIRDITEQQAVYMLPSNESVVETVDVEFILEDYSGQFDPSDSRLLIQKPIEVDGERRLQTVSADTFGAANSFIATLEQDQRYVLIVENEQGIERPQGDYVAREGRQAVLEVGTIEWTAEESAYRWRAFYQNATDGAIVGFAYSDPAGLTTDVEVTVRDRTDESNVLHTETFDGPVGNVSFTADVPPEQRNTTWEVVWSATREGSEIEGSRVVAGQVGEVENPLGEGWALLVVGTLLVFVSLIFGGATAGIGTVIVGGFASLLWWMGWLPAPALVVVGALIVAVLYAGGDRL